MFDFLSYPFMQKAFFVGLLLAVMLPALGLIMVHRRTSMVGDALSHASLAGVALGLLLGFDPVLGALGITVFAGLSMDFFRRHFPQFGDMATALVTSTGLGLASVLSDFSKGGAQFSSYLFGSITTVSSLDLGLVTLSFFLVMGFSLYYYQALLSISISPSLARISGVPVKKIETAFTILSALIIALACKIVGALMVSSLLVLPVATSLLFARSYRSVYRSSILLGILNMVTGLLLSYHFGLKPGGSFVLSALFFFFLILAFLKLKKKSRV